MDHLQVVYRDVDRTPLLYVIAAMAERHEHFELQIRQVRDGKAYERGFLAGEFDLICEHLRFLFPARRAGHPVRCLAACQNRSTDRLLAREGIDTLQDLDSGTVAVRATESSRLSATYWLKHLGLQDRVRVLVVEDEEVGRWRQWRKVAGGDADAVICSPLYQEPAIAAGLHRLDVQPLPQIGSLFFAALGPFVERNDALLRRFMRALYRALCAVHHDAPAVLAIMCGKPAELMKLRNDAALERHYEHLRESLDERPIPQFEALAVTSAMLAEGDGTIAGMNPLALWDLHYLLELEDSRFMEGLASRAENNAAGWLQ